MAGAEALAPNARHHPGRGASFSCGPGSERLAAELADLVGGSWQVMPGVRNVVLMANSATVPRELPARASPEALTWWHRAVTTNLAPTRRRSRAFKSSRETM